MNILILMMAGIGSRYGANIPKQFTPIDDRPLFLPIVESYHNLSFIDKIVIVCHPDWCNKVRDWILPFKKSQMIVAGGKNRSESVRNGLFAVSDFAADNDIILIHDATHPYIDIEGTEEVIEKTKIYGAATLATFGYDTVYHIDENQMISEVLQRERVVNGASPEAFIFSHIFNIYKHADDSQLEKMTSAGAIALEYKIPMAFVKTDMLNLKITFERDMQIYKNLGEKYFFKVKK